MRRQRVKFCKNVRVEEYARVLDGGCTVPGDGSKVSLGLGKKIRSSTARLASAPPPGQQPVEERTWVPEQDRVRMLIKSQGLQEYLKTWLRHRREVIQATRLRQEAKEDPVDKVFMPGPGEAHERALELSAEVRTYKEEVAQAVRESKKLSPKVSFSVDLKAKKKEAKFAPGFATPPKAKRAADSKLGNKRWRSPSPAPRRVRPRLDAAGSSAEEEVVGGMCCHRCGLRISIGPMERRCSCLSQQSSLAAPPPSLSVALPLPPVH